jgi:uncharacterized BrkB/YihY/UPF0761 family membrane protein
MATHSKPARSPVWQRLLWLAATGIFVFLTYRNAPPDPEMWRWSLFGVGLGLAGAVVGALVAVGLIVHRHRSETGRHVHN